MPNTFKYNIQERETKKNGILYDIYFYIQTPDGRKQKKLCGFKTKKLAKQAYEQFMEKYIATPQKYNGKTVVRYELARKEYTGYLKPILKESSLYDIVHNARKHCDPFFAGREMCSITKKDIVEWQDYMWSKTYKGKPLTQRTLSRVHTQFFAFYKWCAEHYNIENVCDGIKMPRRKDVKEPRVIWTEPEFEQFITEVKDLKYKAIFTTLFYGGCRVGELQALQDSDYDGNQIYVHKSFSKKTLDGTPYKITQTKNYKSRYVPLPQKAIQTLDEWVKYKKENSTSTKSANTYLFHGETPISLNAIRNAFTNGINKSGVKTIRIHDLRHSYVSLLMSKGANFGVIAALIGDTLEQVVETYAHHTEEDKINAIKLL